MIFLDGPNGNITISGTLTAANLSVGNILESPSAAVVGPPTSGTFAVGATWTDSLYARWRCTVAGTPGEWVQITPAVVTGPDDVVDPTDGYWVQKTPTREEFYWVAPDWIPVFLTPGLY